MDNDTMAELEMLRSEIAQLRTEFLASGADGGGGADMAGLPLIPIGGGDGGAFQVSSGEIKYPYFQFGRIVKTASLPSGKLEDGTYYLKVTHSSGDGAVITTSEASSLTQTVIPLFTLSDGEITADYRGMPVIPVRE